MSSPRNQTCLSLLVSKATLERALKIFNSVLLSLEKEEFPVSIHKENCQPFIRIFSQDVTFGIVETYRQIRIEASEGKRDWLSPRMRYEPTGLLEFRAVAGSWGGSTVRESKKLRLEDVVPKLVGAMMREGRSEGIRAEQRIQEEIKRRQRDLERQELAQQIQEEEKRVTDLDSWVMAWVRAEQYRQFIAVLEKAWSESGHDLSVDSEKGKRILWMKQQADRLDPLLASPPSVLDRKRELNRY